LAELVKKLQPDLIVRIRRVEERRKLDPGEQSRHSNYERLTYGLIGSDGQISNGRPVGLVDACEARSTRTQPGARDDHRQGPL